MTDECLKIRTSEDIANTKAIRLIREYLKEDFRKNETREQTVGNIKAIIRGDEWNGY